MIGSLAGGLGGAPPIDPDDARRAADDILDDAAYAEPTQSLLDRAVEWIFDRLADVVDAIPGGGPGSGIAWVFVVALVLLAGYFLVRALRVPSARLDDEDDGLSYGTETSRDPTVWMDEAGRLAAAGDHRGALRCRHQALVAVLVTDGIVADVAGRTAGEYAVVVGAALPAQVDRMATITDRFDGAWYGGRDVDAVTYESFSSDCAAVEAVSRRTADDAGIPA